MEAFVCLAEPEPAVTDCWAQGSVPRSFAPPKTPDVLRVENLEVVEEVEEDREQAEQTQPEEGMAEAQTA